MSQKTTTVYGDDMDTMDLDDERPPPSTQVFWQGSQTPWAENAMRKDPRVSSKRERGVSVDSTLFTPASTYSNHSSFSSAQSSQKPSSRRRSSRRSRQNADEVHHPFAPELFDTLRACGSAVDRNVSAASSSVPQRKRVPKQSLTRRTVSASEASTSRARPPESPLSSSTDIDMSSFSSLGGSSFECSSHEPAPSNKPASLPSQSSLGPARVHPSSSRRQTPYPTSPKLPISQRPVVKHPTLVDQQLRSAEKPARRNSKPDDDILPSFDFSSNSMAQATRSKPRPIIDTTVHGSQRQNRSPLNGPPVLGMRPSASASQSATKSKTPLPSRQKPFKPPLLRKIDDNKGGNSQISPVMSRPFETPKKPVEPLPDSSHEEEGDISFGEIVPFDFDSDDLSNIPDLNT